MYACRKQAWRYAALFILGNGVSSVSAAVAEPPGPVQLSAAPLANILPPTFSSGASAIDAQEQIRHQERERILQQQNTPQTDIRLSCLKPHCPIIPTMNPRVSE